MDHAPKQDEPPSNEASGPWLVKPQILGGTPALAAFTAEAHNNAEIYAAVSALLGKEVEGRPVVSVLIERKFTPIGDAFLRFECDAESAGIRIAAGAGIPPDRQAPETTMPTAVVAPDPEAVIAGVDDLAPALPDGVRTAVAEAGRMLAPLFFGYEATLMEIAPLMLLSDGGWAAGNVRMAIDEHALFRHPELLSLVERRDYAYRDVRLRRRHGVGVRALDPSGAVAVVACGGGYGAFLLDELASRGVSPHCLLEANPAALNTHDESLNYILETVEAAASLRCLLLAITGDLADLQGFAGRFADALAQRPAPRLPIVARLAGAGAGTAGAILEQAAPAVRAEPDLESALDAVAGHVGAAE
jgi:succinyl-CoA synthetase beta subunit